MDGISVISLNCFIPLLKAVSSPLYVVYFEPSLPIYFSINGMASSIILILIKALSFRCPQVLERLYSIEDELCQEVS